MTIIILVNSRKAVINCNILKQDFKEKAVEFPVCFSKQNFSFKITLPRFSIFFDC